MDVAVRNIPHWLVSSIRAAAISSLLSEMTNQVTWCGWRSADSVSLPGFGPKALPAPRLCRTSVGPITGRFGRKQEGDPAIMITRHGGVSVSVLSHRCRHGGQSGFRKDGASGGRSSE